MLLVIGFLHYTTHSMLATNHDGHKPDSHKKRLPTRHTYNKPPPSAKKHRVSSSPDVVVAAVVSQSQTQLLPASPPTTTISNGLSDASVAGLEDIVNRLFVSPSRPPASPLADDAAIAEMTSGGPIHSLNFGNLQQQKNKLAKKTPFKLDFNSVYHFL